MGEAASCGLGCTFEDTGHWHCAALASHHRHPPTCAACPCLLPAVDPADVGTSASSNLQDILRLLTLWFRWGAAAAVVMIEPPLGQGTCR